MLELLPTPAPHVIAFRAGGTINTDDFDRIAAAIDAGLRTREQVSIYAEIVNLGGFTLSALLKDIAYGLKQIANLRQYARYAVVTDAQWLRTIADVENKLLPGIEIRTFSLEEDEAAMGWVTKAKAPAEG